MDRRGGTGDDAGGDERRAQAPLVSITARGVMRPTFIGQLVTPCSSAL